MRALLISGLDTLGIALPDSSVQQLLDFVSLLGRWNRAFNLTSVRDPQQMVTRHLLDSLAAAPWLHGRRILDVGTGAGLPGIPLAIAFPDREFLLLDSNGKKTRFVTQAIAELGLGNARAAHARAEQYRTEAQFDSVISRAFSSLHDLVQRAGHLCASGGRLLAMKGTYPVAELHEIPLGYAVTDVLPLRVPGLDGARHLVVLEARPDVQGSPTLREVQ